MRRAAALALLALCSSLAQAEVTIRHAVAVYFRPGGDFWRASEAAGSDPNYEVTYGGSVASVSGGGHYGAMWGRGTITIDSEQEDGRASGFAFVNDNRWDDELMLHSATLPAGSAVQLEVTLNLRSQQVGAGAGQLVTAWVACGNHTSNFIYFQGEGLAEQRQTGTCNGTIGTAVNFDGVFYGRTGVETFGGDVTTRSFAGDAWYSVRAITPDVTISSASGALYLQPVPEPGSYALMLGGLALLGLLRRPR